MPIPSINLDRIPDYIEPVNRELWFETSSTASNENDFKYIFKVQWRNEPFDTNQYIENTTIYKVPPRPIVGNGFFTPHKILQSYFQFYPSPFQKGWISGFVGNIGQNAGILDNYFEYRLKYGFEYNPNLTFSQCYNYLGNLGLSFSQAPGLIAGDLITIDKTNKFINPSYDGTASVIGTQSATQIILDIPFGVASTNESGVITNLQRISATTSSRYTFNGTRQYWELDKDYTQYIMGYTASPALFLTDWDYNTPKPVIRGLTNGLHSYETISMLCNTFTASYATINVYAEDGTNLTGFSIVLSTLNRFRRLDLGVGPQNITDQFGLGLIDFTDPNISYYDVCVKSGVATQSVVMRYKLVDNCYISVQGFDNYEPTTILWLNRLGGWDYFTFTKDNKKTLSIKRDTWIRTLDVDYTYGKIYTQAERGVSNLMTEAETTYEVKSNWITDIESKWLESLFTSTEAYVIINGTYSGGNTNVYQDFTGRIAPINIQNTSYEVQNTMRKKMYNITLQYKMAYTTNLQNE